MPTEGTRRCDATCHYAKRRKCNCFCAGLFHGPEGRERLKKFLDDHGINAGYEALSSEENFEVLASQDWQDKLAYANGTDDPTGWESEPEGIGPGEFTHLQNQARRLK